MKTRTDSTKQLSQQTLSRLLTRTCDPSRASWTSQKSSPEEDVWHSALSAAFARIRVILRCFTSTHSAPLPGRSPSGYSLALAQGNPACVSEPGALRLPLCLIALFLSRAQHPASAAHTSCASPNSHSVASKSSEGVQVEPWVPTILITSMVCWYSLQSLMLELQGQEDMRTFCSDM